MALLHKALRFAHAQKKIPDVYPVMPFDYYTKVTAEDVKAIKDCMFSLRPVHAPRQPSHLAFPFNIRTRKAARTLGLESWVPRSGAWIRAAPWHP